MALDIYQQQNIEMGLCVGCGKANEDRTYHKCPSCRERSRQRYQEEKRKRLGQSPEDFDAFLPTPERIQAMCKRFQQSWTPSEFLRRRYGNVDGGLKGRPGNLSEADEYKYTIPEVSMVEEIAA